ncbi:MAG TPA: twin-arginine translocase TatA/TatE family subunit [Candidatus Sulfomarinibacteraceae bacterium]|nr:twin-arginine translocase TatA/TatE family subunit [Candidatus Sulfomarinibacteraceae bacterium]
MPFNIQGPELIILLVIALLVLGPGKLPEVGSALGKTIREFRKAASDVKESTNLDPAKAVSAPAEAPRVAAPAAAPVSASPAVPQDPAVVEPAAGSSADAGADKRASS